MLSCLRKTELKLNIFASIRFYKKVKLILKLKILMKIMMGMKMADPLRRVRLRFEEDLGQKVDCLKLGASKDCLH